MRNTTKFLARCIIEVFVVLQILMDGVAIAEGKHVNKAILGHIYIGVLGSIGYSLRLGSTEASGASFVLNFIGFEASVLTATH